MFENQNPQKGEVVMYQPNETIRIEVRMENETVWLTQAIVTCIMLLPFQGGLLICPLLFIQNTQGDAALAVGLCDFALSGRWIRGFGIFHTTDMFYHC